MHVRNSAKALVYHEGKILVNRCTSSFGEYFALPGGGQRFGETLTEAIKRELLEETGYSVEPLRLSGIYERVNGNRSDQNGHKIYFVFLCKLKKERRLTPTETDRYQIGSEWIDVKDIRHCNLFPRAIRDNIHSLLGYGETLYLGSERD